MSNYPDGMTHGDWSHVFGPDYEIEREEERDVEHWPCTPDEEGEGYSGPVLALVTDSGPEYVVTVRWTCPRCGKEETEEEDWKD